MQKLLQSVKHNFIVIVRNFPRLNCDTQIYLHTVKNIQVQANITLLKWKIPKLWAQSGDAPNTENHTTA